MQGEQPGTGRARGPRHGLRRVAAAGAFVLLGVLAGVVVIDLFAPRGMIGRLAGGGAERSGALLLPARSLAAALLFASSLLLRRLRWDKTAFAMLALAILAVALPARPPEAPEVAPVAPTATALPAPAPPAPQIEPAPEPAPPAASAGFVPPPGCALLPPLPAAQSGAEVLSTCGFAAGNGNTRLLELRRRALAPGTGAPDTAAMLAADRPQPAVAALGGYEILSYAARALDPPERPEGFDACIRADEVRAETAPGGLSWSERRYLCRATDDGLEVALILREGHAPEALSADFDALAQRLFASLPALRGNTP